jgi:predicted porin
VSYNVTPAFNVGGGVAYVGATDAGGPYGDNLVEIDAGANYKFNANLLLQLFGGYLIPDKGDSAWALAWRTVYNF